MGNNRSVVKTKLRVRIVGGRGLVRSLVGMPAILEPESVRLLGDLAARRLPPAT